MKLPHITHANNGMLSRMAYARVYECKLALLSYPIRRRCARRCPWRKTCQFAKLAHKSAGRFFHFSQRTHIYWNNIRIIYTLAVSHQINNRRIWWNSALTLLAGPIFSPLSLSERLKNLYLFSAFTCSAVGGAHCRGENYTAHTYIRACLWYVNIPVREFKVKKAAWALDNNI